MTHKGGCITRVRVWRQVLRAPRHAGSRRTTRTLLDRHDALTPSQPAADLVTTDSFVLRHSKVILFLAAALCVAGAYCAYTMPASVFPRPTFRGWWS